MKLSDLNQGEKRKRSFLLYGDSGAGKTCLAASFPGPIRYFDLDRKISSAADFYAEDKTRLDSIDFSQYENSLTSKERPFLAFAKDLNAFAPKASEYKTVVFDSLTTLGDLVMSEEMKQRPGKADRDSMQGVEVPNMKDYQVAITYMKNLLTQILTLDCENIVITAHIMRDKDEASGSIKSTLQIWGKDLPSYIPKLFEEVYRVFAKKEGATLLRNVQTQPDHLYVARSQIKKLPPVLSVNNGYEDLKKFL